MLELQKDGYLDGKSLELTERATLFLEEAGRAGRLFQRVVSLFVDSGLFPERNGDVSPGRSSEDRRGHGDQARGGLLAPVTAHFGRNNVAQYGGDPNDPAGLIGGCTLEQPEKIVYIDELDEDDNVYLRLKAVKEYAQPNANKIKPEMEWLADGTVLLTLCFPAGKKIAEAAALECARRMGLTEAAVISREVLHRRRHAYRDQGQGRFQHRYRVAHHRARPDVMTKTSCARDRKKTPCGSSAAPSARRALGGLAGDHRHQHGASKIRHRRCTISDVRFAGKTRWRRDRARRGRDARVHDHLARRHPLQNRAHDRIAREIGVRTN